MKKVVVLCMVFTIASFVELTHAIEAGELRHVCRVDLGKFQNSLKTRVKDIMIKSGGKKVRVNLRPRVVGGPSVPATLINPSKDVQVSFTADKHVQIAGSLSRASVIQECTAPVKFSISTRATYDFNTDPKVEELREVEDDIVLGPINFPGMMK